MNFPKGGKQQCPVEGCPGVSETRAAMWVHFVHRHVHDTVVILEEVNLPLPRCPRCDLQVTRRALNGRHLGTNQCRILVVNCRPFPRRRRCRPSRRYPT